METHTRAVVAIVSVAVMVVIGGAAAILFVWREDARLPKEAREEIESRP